jgi:hypothetical protein
MNKRHKTMNKAMSQINRTISEWLFNIRVALFSPAGKSPPSFFLVPILNPPFC